LRYLSGGSGEGFRKTERKNNIFQAATYNVHQWRDRHGRKDPNKALRVIRSLQADVLAIQEVSFFFSRSQPFHLRDLEHATGMRAVPGMTLCRKDSHFGNVLLTGHRVHDIRRLDLSVKGREPRGAIIVTVEMDKVPIRVVATHLGLKRYERRHQLRQILDEVRRSDPGVILILGDLNEWRPFGMVSRFVRTHFGRTWSPPSYPSHFPVLALDRILVRPARARKTIEAVKTPPAPTASDHLPVAAIIDPRAF
jgi:endonuclease/exonuclease/phosphatase family metal-dependent hydrolase